MGPAYRIETERLVLRCYELADAARLKAAIDSSLDGLLPWLAWAREEPQPLDTKLDLVRQFRGKFDLGMDFIYAILDKNESQLVGGCGLHTRAGANAREIGYWLATRHVGQGFATEAAAALTRVGFEVERLERVEIHCDPDNARSRAIPEKLGFRHDGTLRQRLVTADGRMGDRMIWSLLAAEYDASPCAKAEVEAYDGLARRILARPAMRARERRSAFR